MWQADLLKNCAQYIYFLLLEPYVTCHKTGLLAGLWEFPNFEVKGEAEISSNSEDILQRLKNNHSV